MLEIRKEMEKAILLRKEGNYKQSNEILTKLVELYPEDPTILFQCACSFDVMGEEAAAVPHYERAIALGLDGEDLEGALLGLGSTYRTLGEYEKSRNIFINGIKLYPTNNAMKVFYSMTLYNLQEHNSAMKILLNALAETSTDTTIKEYRKAIDFYADKLDTIWE